MAPNNPDYGEHEEPPQQPPLQATIQYIQEQPNKGLPLVGYFPSGFDPVNNQEPPKVRVYKNRVFDKRMELVVTPSGSSTVDFAGTNYLGEGRTFQACKYALGVLDKDSGVLKIVPIAANKVFRLEPKVRNVDSVDKELGSQKEELSREEILTKRRELTDRYETTKSRKRAKKLHALKQVEANSQEVLDKKMTGVAINTEALESTSADIARNIPPYDASAPTPQEAYPLNKIIMQGEWGFLEDIYHLLQEGVEVSSNAYPRFVRNRIHKLQETKDEAEKKRLACIFSYITHLIKFKDQHSMEGFSSARNHRIPNILHQKFKSKFGNPESKRLSLEKINLLMSYVLVLTLHADEFLTNPDDIAQDLRESAIKLRPHFENLGCKLRRENSAFFITLPVPLQFPDVNRRKRRR